MYHQVLLQTSLPQELLPTLLAAEAELSSVSPHVQSQMAGGVEAGVALFTLVGFGPGMEALVDLQIASGGKRLAAVAADVGPFPRVEPYVHREVPLLAETLPAEGTAVRPEVGVTFHVLLETAVCSEKLAAQVAKRAEFLLINQLVVLVDMLREAHQVGE